MKALFTLVQHSGHTKPGFGHAVEEAAVTRQGDVEKILAAGGRVFLDYMTASEAALTENYPPEVTGLYPKVRGTFAAIQIGGRKLYIPGVLVPV